MSLKIERKLHLKVMT